jgi:hypothetical protein
MEVGIGVPSKYFDLPVASLGSIATVTLKRARRVRPQRTKKVSRMWSSGVRRPREKAAAAGATPKDIYIACMVRGGSGEGRIIVTYQISERIELLAHERGLLPPARYLSVHEVEGQAQGDETECPVEVGVVCGVALDAVAEGGEDGHDAAEACATIRECPLL